MKEKEYDVSFKSIEEFIIQVSASNKEEALLKAEDLLLASDYKKLKTGVKNRHYNLCEIRNKKPHFSNKDRGFVFFVE